jgi:hypothetical protein
LNSISWANNIQVPEAIEDGIDSVNLVFRIDIRDFNWGAGDRTGNGVDDPLDAWEHLLKDYPYGFPHNFDGNDPQFDNIVDLTESRMPYLFGDWLVERSAQPPLYRDILDLPFTQPEFLQLFNVDAVQNLSNNAVIWAAFEDSGVSENNRMIERHEGANGHCWVSYDFAAPQQDGDGRILFDTTPLEFTEDGGEAFCQLPNGLQAYYLYETNGDFLDEGPIEVVQANDGGPVTNGLDCFECHYRGIIPKDDEMLDHVEYLNANGFLSNTDYQKLLAILPTNEELNAQYLVDQAGFLDAQEQTGAIIAYETDLDDTVYSADPIFQLAAHFTEELTIYRVAAEVGIATAQVETQLDNLPSSALTDQLITLASGGTIDRDIFTLAARDLFCVLRDGSVCADTPDGCGESDLACLTGQSCIGELSTDTTLLAFDDDGDGFADDAGACVDDSFLP